MRLFHEVRDNDWVIEEMPDVFALIGPSAVSSLETYLENTAYPVYSRLVAATCLMQIAIVHPHTREKAVGVMAAQLSEYIHNTPGMNGVLIANLVELDAVENADLIHQVYKDGMVDRFIVGDWRDVKIRLQAGANKTSAAKQKGLERSIRISPDPEKKPDDRPQGSPENPGEKQV